jgi:hypothetical protein
MSSAEAEVFAWCHARTKALLHSKLSLLEASTYTHLDSEMNITATTRNQQELERFYMPGSRLLEGSGSLMTQRRLPSSRLQMPYKGIIENVI